MSVGLSVCRSVGLSVCLSVENLQNQKNQNSLIIFDYLIDFLHCWGDRGSFSDKDSLELASQGAFQGPFGDHEGPKVHTKVPV